MRSFKIFATYRVTADSTAQAIKVAEEYRRKGWRCSSRGRRLVLTTTREEYLAPDSPIVLWQMDRSSHEVACQEWLVPELRGGRRREGGSGLALDDEGDEEAGAPPLPLPGEDEY